MNKPSVAEAMQFLEENVDIRISGLNSTESELWWLNYHTEYQFLKEQPNSILDYIDKRMVALFHQYKNENFFYFYAALLLEANLERYLMSVFQLTAFLQTMKLGGLRLESLIKYQSDDYLEFTTWPFWEACGGIRIVSSKFPLGE